MSKAQINNKQQIYQTYHATTAAEGYFKLAKGIAGTTIRSIHRP